MPDQPTPDPAAQCPDLWCVKDDDGRCIYRGADLELADDIYGSTPGGHLIHEGPAAA